MDADDAGTLKFKIKISISLISHLRDFQMNNHEYLDGYIEKIRFYLDDLIRKNPELGDLAKNFLAQKSETSIDLILLAIHFIFGSIANVEQMLKYFGYNNAIPDLSKSHVNRTNILNIHSINDALLYLKRHKVDVVRNIPKIIEKE